MMIREILPGVLFLFLLSFTGEVFAGSEITSDLKHTIDRVLEIVTDADLKKNPILRREKLRHTIGLHFNYKQMVIRSLAKNYKTLTEKEREEFTELFKKLLEISYASKIENYQDQKINYLDEQIIGNYALIKTQIVRNNGNMDIDYKMINEEGQWKVYDFVIEEVSLIRNYRSQFSKIIKTESYGALVSKLSKKVKELEANQSKASKNL